MSCDRLAFVLDIDGTLDIEKGRIYPPIFSILAKWIDLGTNIIFATNRPRSWVQANLIHPIVLNLRQHRKGSIHIACEQGAAVSEVVVLQDRPRRLLLKNLRTWPLRYRSEIERVVHEMVVCHDANSRIRQGVYWQVCLENRGEDHAEALDYIQARFGPSIRSVNTRSTMTILNRNAGKDIAVRFIMKNVSGYSDRNVIGFGDDGDEFATEVPTIDVDRFRRGTFLDAGLNATPVYDPYLCDKFELPELLKDARMIDDLEKGGGVATASFLSGLLLSFLNNDLSLRRRFDSLRFHPKEECVTCSRRAVDRVHSYASVIA